MRAWVSHPTPEPAVAVLEAAGLDVRVGGDAAGADGVLAHLIETIDEAFLDRVGPQLKVVANFAVGTNNIDVAACQARGVVVTNTPDVLTTAVAEHALALMLGAAKHIAEGDRMIRAGRWRGWSENQIQAVELRGKTLGIVGMGRTGQEFARMAETALEMRIISSRPLPLDELLAEADVVSLHVPLRPETTHLIGARELALMKPKAILLNIARGPVVDEAALAEALAYGTIRGAALDVFEQEPQVHQGLLAAENAVLSPHRGSATAETRSAMARLAAENVVSVLLGRGPKTPVSG